MYNKPFLSSPHALNTKPFLTCYRVIYEGYFSEDIFFVWINKIKCIDSIKGEGSNLYLYLTSDNLTTQDIYDLLAFFKRFKVDLKQLKPFLNEENKELFLKNKKAFWYKDLFIDPEKKTSNQKKKVKI